jgi:hypothetical protein
LTGLAQLLERRADWFVAASWIVCLLAVPAALLIGAGAGISAHYGRLLPSAPYARFDLNAASIALAVAPLAAIVASIALAVKQRLIAAAAPLGIWVIFLLGVAGARQLVQPGPQDFTRYVGTQRFVVPWQYEPKGRDDPNSNGFSVRMCMPEMRGAANERCPDNRQAWVRPPSWTRATIFEELYWFSHRHEMSGGDMQHHHRVYTYTPPQTGPNPLRTRTYHAQHDAAGELQRLVVCSGFHLCDHHARVRDVLLSYSAPPPGLVDWEQSDRRFADLTASWKR